MVVVRGKAIDFLLHHGSKLWIADQFDDHLHHGIVKNFFLNMLAEIILLPTLSSCPGTAGALIEGQKTDTLARKLGDHPDFDVIYAEIIQKEHVELTAALPWVSVVHLLSLGVLDDLSEVLVLLLKSEHRDTVDGQHHIYQIVCGIGTKMLGNIGDNVLRIVCSVLLLQRGLRLKVARLEP